MKRGAPIKPGKGFAPRSAPMARGTAVLKRSEMKAGSVALKRAATPMKAVGQRAKRTGQGKVAPSAAEAAWMDAAQAFGCIVCWRQHQARVPAEIHHLKAGDRRRGHLFSIGLCVAHHRGGQGDGPFISRHPWKTRFEAAYGSEDDLLAHLRNSLIQGNMAPLSSRNQRGTP